MGGTRGTRWRFWGDEGTGHGPVLARPSPRGRGSVSKDGICLRPHLKPGFHRGGYSPSCFDLKASPRIRLVEIILIRCHPTWNDIQNMYFIWHQLYVDSHKTSILENMILPVTPDLHYSVNKFNACFVMSELKSIKYDFRHKHFAKSEIQSTEYGLWRLIQTFAFVMVMEREECQ